MTSHLHIINQFRGIGDIIFCEHIAKQYIDQGHHVLWPVHDPFYAIQKHYPHITFIPQSLFNIDYNDTSVRKADNYTIIPLRFSDQIMKVKYKDCMRSKYMMAEMPLQTWRKTEILRDHKAEDRLFYDVLGLTDKDQYILLNKTYMTKATHKRKFDFKNPDKLKVIEMKIIPKFTVIDWSRVIENATLIHTVSTSIFYLLELLNTAAFEIHLYDRNEEKGFALIDYLFTKEYILHQS